MIDWNVRTVAELQRDKIILVEDGNHGEYRPRKHEFVPDGVPFIRPPDLVGGTVDFSNTDRINEVAFQRVRKGIGAPGDILFSHRATVGRIAKVPADSPTFVTNPGITFYRVLDRNVLDPDFLYYWMQTALFMDQVWAVAGGSDTFPYASLSEQRKLNIHFPDISVQRQIGLALRLLDDKIELNRRMSATLEEMARSLYRSWFVDFDPVHARALGQSPTHMDATTAALFPDSFGPDGLPKGWEWWSLDDIADFLNGAALQKFPPEDRADSLPVIKIAELRSGITSKSGRAGLQVPEKYKIHDGDVLFSWSGSLLQKVWTEGPGALNQHLFKVSSEVVPKWFHFFAVDQHMEEFRQVAASKATTMGHIQRHHLKEAMIAMPEDDAIIAAAGELIGPAFDRAIAVDLESQTLAALRDALLPRLMSGELRIREAEKQVEAVV